MALHSTATFPLLRGFLGFLYFLLSWFEYRFQAVSEINGFLLEQGAVIIASQVVLPPQCLENLPLLSDAQEL